MSRGRELLRHFAAAVRLGRAAAAGRLHRAARRAPRPTPKILVVLRTLPKYDRDAGSRCDLHHLHLMSAAGLDVAFYPDDRRYDERYARPLERLGVRLLVDRRRRPKFAESLRQFDPDYVWIARPRVLLNHLADVRLHGRAPLLYFTSDLHHLREAARYRTTGNPYHRARAAAYRVLERTLIGRVDAALSPSLEELRRLRDLLPEESLHWMPVYTADTDGDERRRAPPAGGELIFVGSFRHAPNVDGLRWFAAEVWPTVVAAVPHARFHIVGSEMPAWVRKLAASNVAVYDSIDDCALADVYRRSRVAVAPLRFGAGSKMKVMEAMDRGAAVVTTACGLEGLPELDRLPPPCDEPQAFARRVAELLVDDDRAAAVVRDQRSYLERHFSPAAGLQRLRAALRSVTTDVGASPSARAA